MKMLLLAMLPALPAAASPHFNRIFTIYFFQYHLLTATRIDG